ncbi:MAG: pyridoxamine 5'-phosphate oxidase family protein [Methylobacterium frigidaeris]
MNTPDPGTAGADRPPDDPLGHDGERTMRRHLPGRFRWDDDALTGMMRPGLSAGLARFIEARPFFFIATASAAGHCDASFRGHEHDAAGEPLPALRVLDPSRLVFPDFSGNGLYNSLGNIVSNPQIGMLFVDFERRRRARVNGRAAVVAADPEIRAIWPLAQAAVLVNVEQAFGNCPARIPRLVPAAGGDRGG